MTEVVDRRRLKYAQQKLHDAIDALAVGPGRINERLHEAFRRGFVAPPTGDDFPGSLRDEFQSIDEAFTAHGTVQKTLAQMSEDDAVNLARRIVEFTYRVDVELGELP